MKVGRSTVDHIYDNQATSYVYRWTNIRGKRYRATGLTWTAGPLLAKPHVSCRAECLHF